MEACAAWQVKDPVAMKGSWRSLYPQARALWVEIGCGKGKFTVETAQANLDILLIAIERCREAMVMAMEKAQDMGLKNVFFVDLDVALMEGCFAFGEIDRMFINFPTLAPEQERQAAADLPHLPENVHPCHSGRGRNPFQDRQRQAVRVHFGGTGGRGPAHQEPHPEPSTKTASWAL